MQKVHTINLGGIIFQIEEDAYEILKNYLSALRTHFQNQAEGLEIANDIEYRLGEMLNQKLTGGKLLIQKNDVESIIAIMGQPTDFDKGEAEDFNLGNSKSNFQNEEQKEKRKFFRDTDGRIIGGVSTGIAAYFGIEPWIIRIIFLISLFFGGAGFIFYIILWIAVPKAKTTADRLAMKGEKPTLDNIVKSVEDRAKELNTGKFTGFLKAIVGFIETILKGILRIFGKVFGAIILFLSSILLLGLIATSQFTSNGGITINDTTLGLNELMGLFFSNSTDVTIIRFVTFVLFCIPLIYLILGGLKLLGSQIKINKIVNYVAISVWFVALFTTAYFGIKTLYEFTAESGSTQTINISTNDGEILEVVPFESVKDAGKISARISDDKSGFILADSGLFISNVELEIEKSKTSEIELIYKASARGKNETEAVRNYKNIVYKFSKVNNQLLLDDFYKLNPGTQFRAQQVKLILRLPEGQQIKLDPFIDRLSLNLNDDDFDYDNDEIAGKILIMTEGGLKCLDCEPRKLTPPNPPSSEDEENDSNNEE
ncbi:MAG: PspC domain-containing protein [Cytophagales bacterium]